MVEVAEVLEKAADLLSKPGAWGQHGYNPREGCFCVLGAISMAAEGRIEQIWGKGLPTKAARAAFGTVGGAVDFNDAPGRTQAEVVAALRTAAANARGDGNG